VQRRSTLARCALSQEWVEQELASLRAGTEARLYMGHDGLRRVPHAKAEADRAEVAGLAGSGTAGRAAAPDAAGLGSAVHAASDEARRSADERGGRLLADAAEAASRSLVAERDAGEARLVQLLLAVQDGGAAAVQEANARLMQAAARTEELRQRIEAVSVQLASARGTAAAMAEAQAGAEAELLGLKRAVRQAWASRAGFPEGSSRLAFLRATLAAAPYSARVHLLMQRFIEKERLDSAVRAHIGAASARLLAASESPLTFSGLHEVACEEPPTASVARHDFALAGDDKVAKSVAPPLVAAQDRSLWPAYLPARTVQGGARPVDGPTELVEARDDSASIARRFGGAEGQPALRLLTPAADPMRTRRRWRA